MPTLRMGVAALLAAVVTTIGVSACAGSSQSPAPEPRPTAHDAADVTFAEKMIPHHQQALDMTAMVPSRTTNHELIVLAKQIALEQQAQIDTLQGLLKQWGQPSPAHDMAGTDMDGMVDAASMARLPTLNGGEFDDLWLRSMIIHHQGAVAMAEPEIAHGQDPTAVKMAKIIIDWQQLEIGRMHAMLGPAE